MSQSLKTGIMGSILGAVGAAMFFALKDENRRSAMMQKAGELRKKGMETAKNLHKGVTNLMSKDQEEAGEGEKVKRGAVGRRALA